MNKSAFPRWRGFHLLNMFEPTSKGDWNENDYSWIKEFGFDFVSLPVCFTLWVEDNNPYKPLEPGLKKLDRGIHLGLEYGLNVCLNLHTAPGYDVNKFVAFPYNLWKDQEALEAFCFQWQILAERYADIPADRLSFHLINEPPEIGNNMTMEDHERVMRAATKVIRKITPDRLVLFDGPSYGRVPCPRLADLGLIQCCRGYWPIGISHYLAPWVGGEKFPKPIWPGYMQDGEVWDRGKLEEHYKPYIELQQKGMGVLCFEIGVFNKTPHEIALAWMRDVLDILTKANIGYVLWEFRGEFGILDSGREDVDYENFHGHKLDRKMLELLQEF